MEEKNTLRYPRHCVLFLDLDGTVRESSDASGFVNKPSDVRILPNAKNQMKRWRRAGWYIIGVTNQAGPSMGLADQSQVIAAVIETSRQLSTKDLGATSKTLFLGIQMCLHHPEDNCLCRKPKTGMLANGIYNLLRMNNNQGVVRPGDCFFVGDRAEDRECAANAGITFLDAAEWREGTSMTIEACLDWPEQVNKPEIIKPN